MKLLYQDSVIELQLYTEQINFLCIEKHSMFRYMVLDFYEQCNGASGPWIYNVNAKSQNIEKSIHCIMNPIQVDVNSKTVLNKLHAGLVKEANLMTEELNSIIRALHTFYYSLEFSASLDIEHKQGISAADLIKLGAFTIHESTRDEISKLIDYIDIVRELLQPDIFVLVNIDVYLDSKELELLFKTILAKQICVLCISTTIDSIKNVDKTWINSYTLDSDFCLL